MNAPQLLASDGDPWLFSDGLKPPHFFDTVADVDMDVVEVKIILDIRMFLASLVVTGQSEYFQYILLMFLEFTDKLQMTLVIHGQHSVQFTSVPHPWDLGASVAEVG
ncbi:hypothetical protein ACFX2J_040112 [Malus domestica]